ncbi:S8 family serine peptidase [Rubrobacter marinus]|uniref:S8 family serine peptidase n=1 Tax=Rubrobacter marinus TaxID=2653852 RepID=A0A6G8PY16_9ACTN|nr:S8 family serine peptidase [Rubrobacter marinus]QIN79058.1 S8 family serine peptidase [Rubrobacter marinus]
MPLKFLGTNGGYTSDAVEAINYAVARGVKISNNSWGGGGFSQALSDAISRADAQGHLFLAAAGNGGSDGIGDDNDAAPHYPSNYDIPNVVSVAATDDGDALASFSNYGDSSVDLAAPGVRILSTLPGNSYGAYSGTSMATPHVAGVAALLKAKNPSFDDAQMKAQLVQSVDTKGNLTGKVATGGRVNSARALGTNPPPQDTTAPETSISSGPSGTTKSTSASFGFAASEPVSRFECSLDGAAFAACASPTAYSGLTSKAHSFRVRAVDRAGNVDATPAVRNWTVDTVLPTATSPSPAPSASTRDRTPLIQVVVRDTQTNLQKANLQLYLDGARVTTFTYDAAADVLRYTPPTNRAYGTHTVRVVATDAAGNVGNKQWSFKIVR